jgi:hypothetical protein
LAYLIIERAGRARTPPDYPAGAGAGAGAVAVAVA